MYVKPFDVGLLVGRFQVFHEGHEALADMALGMCDRLLILVGSAQESGTHRNPFSVATRIEMIKEIYPGANVIISPLPDMTNEDDICVEWGKYLLQRVRTLIHKNPDFMIYGNDEARSGWFAAEDITSIAEFILPRDKLGISATQMRTAMLANDRAQWFKHHNKHLHKHFDRLRDELLACDSYR